jgi:predicted aspartyl protease/tetratricopeptide (TPR) repeat protein
MTTQVRLFCCIAVLQVLFAVLSQAVEAADSGKCKISLLVKFPVIMEGPRASVPAVFNGHETRVWLDSGAFFNFMPKAKAVELGLTTEPLPAGFYVSGIGGSYTPELARVRDFGIAGVTLHNVEFVVGGSDVGNGFLGANFLGFWDTEFDLAKGAVNLFKETKCDRATLAYWGTGMSVGEARLFRGDQDKDYHIYVEVIVNGHSLRALLDSGAPDSLIGRHAAERAGIDLTSPQVVGSVKMTGVGSRQRQSWIARAPVISIGGEEIRNTPIRVIDDAGDNRGFDMLLGVDFLMAHHVIVSQIQRKMFLTYNGGPIFSATTDREIGQRTTRAVDMGESEKAPDPKTADEFAGRASARLVQGDVIGAIADYTDAIHLAPGRADLLDDRAGAYMRGRHPELAASDIDAALVIAPNAPQLLTRRAQIKLSRGDKSGALSDTDAAVAGMPKGSLDVMPIVTLYERLGMASRGTALIDQVVALHHDDAKYASLLNASSWNRGLANADLDRALKDANAAIRQAGPIPSFLDTRALIQYRRKDYSAAIADEGAALDKMPKLPAALFIRGLSRLAKGDTANGGADIAAARESQPKIDEFYALYGLIAPAPEPSKTVKSTGAELEPVGSEGKEL